MSLAYGFTDHVALVTGAGSGIGRASALAFAQSGAAVIAAGRTKSGIDVTVDLIQDHGGSVTGVTVDVSDAEQARELVDRIIRSHGRLDIAHNNAGVFPTPSPVADMDTAAWDDAVGTNLNGMFYCLQAETQPMRSAGGGVIVNTAANIGRHSHRPGLAAYVATKAAVSALTATAARDHIGDGVRINAVSPGSTATSMSLRPGETDGDRAQRVAQTVPIGRVGEVSEIVNTVLWLASPESSFVVGHDLVADGGAAA